MNTLLTVDTKKFLNYRRQLYLCCNIFIFLISLLDNFNKQIIKQKNESVQNMDCLRPKLSKK